MVEVKYEREEDRGKKVYQITENGQLLLKLLDEVEMVSILIRTADIPIEALDGVFTQNFQCEC
ncbi:hypothetical protein M0R89_09200 [Halorussus limi]|uniref:Uncharacterized protein n=1 Tax=Halorussus limi TaxID=2938695 RepID=A0A8U0HPV5_9EURY|nr:hypothetical protein [Halorussus limi]UPV72724.1 hypothetical protein M0R89_09200 [Halorussus limi]